MFILTHYYHYLNRFSNLQVTIFRRTIISCPCGFNYGIYLYHFLLISNYYLFSGWFKVYSYIVNGLTIVHVIIIGIFSQCAGESFSGIHVFSWFNFGWSKISSQIASPVHFLFTIGPCLSINQFVEWFVYEKVGILRRDTPISKRVSL